MLMLSDIQRKADILLYGSEQSALEAAQDLFGIKYFENGLLYRDFTEQKFRALIYDFYPLTQVLFGFHSHLLTWHEFVTRHISENRESGRVSLFRLGELLTTSFSETSIQALFSKYEWIINCLSAGVESAYIIDKKLGWLQSNYNLPKLMDSLSVNLEGSKDIVNRLKSGTYHQDSVLFEEPERLCPSLSNSFDVEKFRLDDSYLFIIFNSQRNNRPITMRLNSKAEPSLQQWIKSESKFDSPWFDFFHRNGLQL